MGLFSSKKKTYVSSTLYNLAGEEADIPRFLPTVVVGAILVDKDEGVGSTIRHALMTGSGSNQRRFFRWAQNNYELGLPEATLTASSTAQADKVIPGLAGVLSLGSQETLRVMSAEIAPGDIDYWAEYYALINWPELDEDEYSAEWDVDTQEIIVTRAGQSEVRMAASSDLLWVSDPAYPNRKLLYVGYRIVTEDVEDATLTQGTPQFFTYRMGTGNVIFDTLEASEQSLGEFLPVLPIRLNNVSIRDPAYSDDYVSIKKAYKKLTGSSIEDFIDSVEDNSNLDDIDYGFVVHGVPFNTDNNAARRYLFEFFQKLEQDQTRTLTDFNDYQAAVIENNAAAVKLDRWMQGGSEQNGLHPLYGTDAPLNRYISLTEPSSNELNFYAPQLPDFKYRMEWTYIQQTQHVGNAKTYDGDRSRGKVKEGDVWIHAGEDRVITSVQTDVDWRELNTYQLAVRQPKRYTRTYLFRQTGPYRYTKLEIVGLQHQNYVYRGSSVLITAKEALDDTEASGFLVPLHYPTLREMSILAHTQMVPYSAYLVLNSYKVVTIRWYQTGLFKVILIIAAIGLSVITAGGSLVAAGGILGSNLAIGTALGITTAYAAAVVGAVANAIASMVITSLIQVASVELFGDKAGAIIGTIVSFVAMTYAQSYGATGSFDVDWGSMMNADNFIKVTNSVSAAYQQWLSADTLDIQEKMAEATEGYEDEMKRIQNLSEEILGMTGAFINPMMLTDATEYFRESSSTFFDRTLLTGSDIAELTHSLIDNFAETSLELPKPIL